MKAKDNAIVQNLRRLQASYMEGGLRILRRSHCNGAWSWQQVVLFRQHMYAAHGMGHGPGPQLNW